MALTTSNVTTSSFTVNWTSHGANVSTYNIEIYQGATLIHNIRDIGAGARSYGFSYGIQSGTTYRIKMFSRTSSNTTINIEEMYVTTQYVLGSVGSISISNVSQNSFYASWNTATNATNYSVEVRLGSSTGLLVYYSYGSLTSTGITIGGLSAGSYYHIKVWATRAGSPNGNPSTTGASTASIPLPSTPTNFRVYDGGATYVSVAWNSSSGANRYVVEVYRASNNVLVWDNRNITGTSVVITGLTNGVTYNIKLYANNGGGNSSPVWLYNVQVGFPRPANWSWTIVKAKGRSYTIVNNRFTNLVSYDEIMRFRTRINEFRVYKNMSQYSFSSISRGTVFTATMYNQMEAAIRAMNPPVSTYGQQSAGSSYTVDELLNRLRLSLNSIT